MNPSKTGPRTLERLQGSGPILSMHGQVQALQAMAFCGLAGFTSKDEDFMGF